MTPELNDRVRAKGTVFAWKVIIIDSGDSAYRVQRGTVKRGYKWLKVGFEDFDNHWEQYPVARYKNG